MKLYLSIKKIILNTVIVFPVVFVLFFWGYASPKYDMKLFVDNIVGEGVCSTTFCSRESFEHYYKGYLYFGSELKEALFKGYNYNVDTIRLTISGVSEAEIEGYDIIVFGHTIAHYSLVGRIVPGEYDGASASISNDGHSIHFTFDDPNVGITIGLLSHFAPIWFWVIYFLILLIAVLIFALLFTIIESKYPNTIIWFMNASGILMAMLIGCYICKSLPYIVYTNFLLNWLFLFCMCMLISAILNPKFGTIIVMLFTEIWYIANYYVIGFRGKPIMPSDLRAVSTAMEVINGYIFSVSYELIFGILLLIVYLICVIYVWNHYNKGIEKSGSINLKKRLLMVLVSVGLFILGLNTKTFKNLDTFIWDAALCKSFHEEGMILTYVKCALSARVKMPDGYNEDTVNEYLSDYNESYGEGVRPTNIIMVMNEAFADLRTVGLNPNIDVMPFIDSLEKNTIKGDLYVSIFSGGTCNTEFEALTGNTLAFLGTGAYPYVEHIYEPLFSLASYFDSIGYDTEAFHDNDALNWNRNIVYPNLGFSKFNSEREFQKELEIIPTLHKLASDEGDYQYIYNRKNKLGKTPSFLFDVTMQNHSGYERWEDVKKADTIERYGADIDEEAQVYLSLIKASDNEIQMLINKYENYDEPTLIVFFGDHQAGISQMAQDNIYTNVESQLDWYKTKFFIWANYNIPSADNISISANYLPWLILETGKFDLPPYIQLLKEVHAKYPVISAMGVIDSDGNIYDSVSNILDDPLIRKYQYVQYANMFDDISPEWFEVRNATIYE